MGYEVVMKKPRIYIAGPMRGLPFYNFPAFDKACTDLNQQGFWAVSPADLDRTLYGMDPWELPEGHNWHEHPAWMPDEEEVLRTDINVLRTCDAVLLLTGWQNSEGAKRERKEAFEHGIGVDDNMDDLVLDLKPLQPVAAGSKATNPKDLIGSDKLPLHLWPTTATAMGCIGMLNGMLKYGRTNFRVAGVRATIYIDAALRHLGAWLEGEECDPDDGVPHLAAALSCLAILVDARAAGKLNDDRMVAGGYRKLVDALTPHVKRLKEHHKDRDPKHYTIADNNPGS
jgi:hypothetical protein